MKESDLYAPLKSYLEGQGYTVHGEVGGCDIIARRGEELVAVEMKRRLSLALVAQAAERKELTDSVYIAIPTGPQSKSPPGFSRTKALLRRLEIGCILVETMKTKRRVRIVLHPYPFTERKSSSKRRAVIREIDGRYAEFDLAGQPSVRERITAYKQQALLVAHLLRINGASSPRQLRERGASEKSQQILSQNVYGWFERVERGLYRLNPAGETALERYGEVLEKILRSSGRSL